MSQRPLGRVPNCFATCESFSMIYYSESTTSATTVLAVARPFEYTLPTYTPLLLTGRLTCICRSVRLNDDSLTPGDRPLSMPG